jgi:hypothetical protein
VGLFDGIRYGFSVSKCSGAKSLFNSMSGSKRLSSFSSLGSF